MADEINAFEGKTLSDLLKDSYDLSTSRRELILSIIGDIRNLITDAGQILVIGPILREYLDVLVKSDDQFLKISTIVQKMNAAANEGPDSFFTEAEKERLLNDLKSEADNLEKSMAADWKKP